MTPDNCIPPADAHISRLMFHIMLEMRTLLERRMMPFGLTFRQAMLLIRCVHTGGAHLHEHVPHMDTDNASISRLADRLESAGFVTRTQGNDRRSVILEPTPKGIAVCPELERVLQDADEELMAGFPPETAEHFRTLLRQILTNVRQSNME
jgi:DNA-binding MarR family transcriptional regulator